MSSFGLLVRGEIRKVAGRKLIWGLLAFVVGFVAITTVALPIVLRFSPEDAAGLDELVAVIAAPSGYVFAAQQAIAQTVLAAVILAAVSVGNEYSWGTLTLTLVLEPRRTRVLIAKIVALTIISMCLALIAWIVGTALAALVQPLVPADVVSSYSGPWIIDAAAAFGRGILTLALWTTIAAFIGILTRSPAAAVGVGIGVTIAEGFLSLAPGVTPVLLTTNATALTSVPDITDLGSGFSAGGATAISVWQAALVLAGYTIAFFMLAAWFLRRRDVT